MKGNVVILCSHGGAMQINAYSQNVGWASMRSETLDPDTQKVNPFSTVSSCTALTN